jgi:hypothetical protein
MSTTERSIPKKPERPIWPTYSWRAKNINPRLLYIRDHRQADAAIVRLRKGPLGFDLEWRPNFIKGHPENPVALVQLSTENTILLIQIYVMESTEILPLFHPLLRLNYNTGFPSKLRELLNDLGVVKAGVGIQRKLGIPITLYKLKRVFLSLDDCKKLAADWNISVRNCVDLSLLARCVDNARWKGRYVEPIGLARLVETYEHLSLPKGKIQRSNWETLLSDVQQDCMSQCLSEI